MGLSGKAAIVTGAAQGIGRAIAWRLAADGAAVHIVDIQTEKGEAEAAAIRDSGLNATFQTADVGDPQQITSMVQTCVEHHGRLDILVNNAWGVIGDALAGKESWEQWDRGFAIMVRALALAGESALPHMRRVGGGAIVNISSVHGFLASDDAAIYDTCKHAVIGVTKGMALDYGPHGVRANTICPGLIVTEVSDSSWREQHQEALFAESYHPLRRAGRPRDIAAGVSYLVSDEAAFVTGHALTIDGGLTIQLQDVLARQTREYVREGRTDRPLRTPPV